MEYWVLTSAVVVALIGVLTGFTAANQPSTQPVAKYRISHLAELSQFQDVRIVALDANGNLLANVSQLITLHGNLYNDGHAVLDLNPGTKHAHVIALRPLHGMSGSDAIGMNGSIQFRCPYCLWKTRDNRKGASYPSKRQCSLRIESLRHAVLTGLDDSAHRVAEPGGLQRADNGRSPHGRRGTLASQRLCGSRVR